MPYSLSRDKKDPKILFKSIKLYVKGGEIPVGRKEYY